MKKDEKNTEKMYGTTKYRSDVDGYNCFAEAQRKQDTSPLQRSTG
jgi:hypothetical protein